MIGLEGPMRLSEWRRNAPVRDAIDDRVMTVLKSLLADFGADPDPECYVVWGDHPDLRHSVLVPVAAGLVAIAVRTAEGTQEARATARLIRWPKLALGEFSLEATGERRVVAVQVESFVLKGADAEAGLIAEFVRGLVLQAENRAATPLTADMVRALTDSLGRIAIPVAAAPAPAGRAAVAGSRAVAGARPVSPRPAPRRQREQPGEIARGPASVRAARKVEAQVVAASVAPVTPLAAAEESAAPAETPVAAEAEALAAPDLETMALTVVEPQSSSEAVDAAPPVEAAPPPAAPRKPRAPRKPATDSADKPKRPRRVHREWPEPAGAPGWDAALPADQRAKKKPVRWTP
jgi:hypothetical protein